MKLRSPLLQVLAITSALGFASAASAAETYRVDPARSSVAFTIKRFFVNVPGSFPKFEATLTFDRDQPERSTLQATVDVAAINTADKKRDEHLRSTDFFETAKFPNATFKSTRWKKTEPDTYEVTGDLTLHGVMKSVVLKIKSLGVTVGQPPGVILSTWEGTTTLQRSDFGIRGTPALGKMLGDNVEIKLNITAEAKP